MKAFLRLTSRYAQVGLLCALLNNAVVIAADHLGYHYVTAVCAAFVLSTAVGYLLHSAYTFQVPASGTSGLRFVIANLTAFPLSMGTMLLLCGGLGLAASIAMPIATVLLFGWNFLLAHFAIARSPNAQEQKRAAATPE